MSHLTELRAIAQTAGAAARSTRKGERISTGRMLAAAGTTQIAIAAASGWPLAAVTARPDLLGRSAGARLRRLRQCHVDLLMMGGLITAAGAVVDPPRWVAASVVVGGWTNPLLFVPLAVDQRLQKHPAYMAASVVSFTATTVGWVGIAGATLRKARRR